MKYSLESKFVNDIRTVSKIVKKTVAQQTTHSDVSHELYEKAKALPFWCYNDTLHLEKDYISKNCTCCFTHFIGLPKKASTLEERPITPYQMEMIERIEASSKRTFHLNKGRQMGFTELLIRYFQWKSFREYAGKKIGIIAGVSESLSQDILARLKELFANIPEVILESNKKQLILTNGTIYKAFSTSDESATGTTKYAAFLMDESSKWKLIKDEPVYNSIVPIMDASKGDLFIISTPKGPKKMFYKIYKERPDNIEFFEYDIWHAEGNLYTKEEIQYMLDHTLADKTQEYLCKFVATEDAAFGDMEKEDYQKFDSWEGSFGD